MVNNKKKEIKSKPILFFAEPSFKQKIQEAAQKEARTTSGFIRYVVKKHMEIL